MANGDPANERISVSRETLRAELAELELRLIQYLDQQLHEKANKVEVVALATAMQDKANAKQFASLEATMRDHHRDLTDLRYTLVQQNKVNEALKLAAREVKETSESAFTKKEKIFGLVAAAITLTIQVWVVTGGTI